MNPVFNSKLGKQLYQLLPEIYRTRDNNSAQNADGDNFHLAKYLDVHGKLLDRIHATLQQQLRDAVPGTSQDWLLPYFAQLVAANLVSPDAQGRHREISQAISWRQRKGTLRCIEEIAEAVGQMEVELQEAWTRVAVTPRIAAPLLDAAAVDSTLDIQGNYPPSAARHPSLPAVMRDFRRPSRAVEAKAANPAARRSRFAGITQSWRQSHPQGAPCFPESFEDRSLRTADLRSPSLRHGHYHHKNVLAYAPPPQGFFSLPPLTISWEQKQSSLYEHLLEIQRDASGSRYYLRNKTDRVIQFSDSKLSLPAKKYHFEGVNFLGDLVLAAGSTLQLSRVEAKSVGVETLATNELTVDASNCLFETLSVPSRVRLRNCTVLGVAYLNQVEAYNCIFVAINGETPTEIAQSEPLSGIIAHSRIPSNLPINTETLSLATHHPHNQPVHDEPQFFSGQRSLAARAVLSPNTPAAIYEGASDGGEMGYFHDGRDQRPVTLQGDLTLELQQSAAYVLRNLVFSQKLHIVGAPITLQTCAVKSLHSSAPLQLQPDGAPIASVDARDCLFDEIQVPQGMLRMEYCTVMVITHSQHIHASDCIFNGEVTGISKPRTNKEQPTFLNCIRFSCLPDGLESSSAQSLMLAPKSQQGQRGNNTFAPPLFSQLTYCTGGEVQTRNAHFGEPGYAVLHPNCSPSICFGAEDGGEMGALHRFNYSLKAQAMLEKMREFLPFGIEPVLLYDSRLLQVPPELTSQQSE